MKTEEMIEVMTAFAHGKSIECSTFSAEAWHDCPNPTWDWHSMVYRVKKEKIKAYVNVYKDCLGILTTGIRLYKTPEDAEEQRASDAFCIGTFPIEIEL